MATFDWDSIDKKIKKASGSAVSTADIAVAAEQAAKDFIGVIQDEIGSSGFSKGQIEAISSWDYGSPYNIGDGLASITVSSSASEGISLYSREAVNLVDVFSRGHTPSKYVYGDWHGAYIRSSLDLTYSDFIGRAVNQFDGHIGNGYEVVSITSTE